MLVARRGARVARAGAAAWAAARAGGTLGAGPGPERMGPRGPAGGAGASRRTGTRGFWVGRRAEAGGGAVEEDFLALADDKLLAQCKVETYRASGPGGQHRNKTSSAVRLTHLPTGVSATATERRSQHENRRAAVGRLRTAIAVGVRREVGVDEGYEPPPELRNVLPGGPNRLGPKHPDFSRGAQHLLDLLQAHGYSLADTARSLNLSTGQLSKLIESSPNLLSAANRMRTEAGLRPLRRSK